MYTYVPFINMNGGFKLGYKKASAYIILFVIFVLSASGCMRKADKLYKEGQKLYDSGKYEEAMAHFEDAIDSNPDKAEYHIAYGKTLTALGRYDEAREKFIDIIRDTDNKIVRENNKKVYMGIAMSYYYEGVYDQAKAYFEIALKNKELSSFNKDINAYIAECDMYLFDYESALKKWNEIIGKKSKHAEYYLGRAKVNTALGYSEDAQNDYRSAISEDSKCYPAYIGLYLMLLEEGNEEGASEISDTALKKLEKDDDNVFYRSVLYYYRGDTDKAAEGFNKELEEGNNQAYYYIGRINQDKNNYEEAVSDYEEYGKACPSDIGADYCNQYAGCLIELGRYEDAKEWISKGVLMAAGSVRQKLMFNEVVVCEKTGDYAAAAQKAGEYLELYKDEKMQQEYEYIKTRYKENKDAE